MKLTAVAACITAMTCLNVSPAKGTETQVWVSSSGKNTGECLITAPCATLQYAYGQAPAGGAINIANSGSYGPIIIKKPISIIAADGVDALIGVAPGSIGVDIQTTGNVLLKGLHIAGQEIDGNIGISNSLSGHLVIDHVTAANLAAGISVDLGFVMIRSSLLFGNVNGLQCIGHAGAYGLSYYPCGVYMGQTTITGNVYGIFGAIASYGDNDMNGNTTCDVCEAIINEVAHDQ